ncbi:MAG: type II toxin-antitoxin system RatA family toxin [Sphingomonadales bacterium]
MPKHVETITLPYTPEQLFEIVLDVEKYPEFLPWCQGVRISNKKEGVFLADLIIGFSQFKERFTSKVSYIPKTEIQVDYIKGPLKYLHNLWTFQEIIGGTEIVFIVDFEFKNPLFEKLVGKLFQKAVVKMINSFQRRAETLF